MPKYILIALFLLLNNAAQSQVNGSLVAINTDEQSPVGKGQFKWACIANFRLSDPQNYGRIKFIDTDTLGNIYIIDNNGYLYALSGTDLSEKWKVKLGYERVLNMAASPDGKTIAICYNYIKAATKKLEVRNADNGRTLLKIKRVPNCYEESYFADVIDNTTLYPYNIAYSPDGSKLAVWFRNHGFDEDKCKSILEEQFIIMSPITGDVYAFREALPNDFDWDKCDAEFPFVFSSDGNSIYIGNCRAQVAQYDAKTLNLIKVSNFGDSIHDLLTEKLDDKGSKKFKFPFNELVVQKDGDLLTSVGKQGRIFKIKADLSSISYITQNQGTVHGHFSFSPDWSMVMFNSNHINLWDLKSKQPILYTETPGTFDAHTVRFHQHKKALIVGTRRTIKILAPCPSTKVHIGENFTSTGHFLNAETSFSVRGNGRIFWAYDDKIIYRKYAKENEISTEPLGYSSLFNSRQNLPKSSELRLKTDSPGVYTIFGGTKQPMTAAEALQSLENWN